MRNRRRVFAIVGTCLCTVGGVLLFYKKLKSNESKYLRSAVKIENLSELENYLSIVPLIIAVTGRVFSRKPIKCEMSKEEAVITHFQVKQDTQQMVGLMNGVPMFYTFTRPIRDTVRETEWGIRDSSGVELPVITFGHHSNIPAFQISETHTPPSVDLARYALDAVVGRRDMGLLTRETYLPVNAQVTGVGELSLGLDNPGSFSRAVRSGKFGSSSSSAGTGGSGKMLVLGPPKQNASGSGSDGGGLVITSLSLAELIAKVEGVSRGCGMWGGLMMTVGVGCLVVSMLDRWREWWTIRQAKEEWRRARAAHAEGRGAEEGEAGEERGEEVRGRRECVVCWINECNAVFPQCGHMCTCARCSAGLDKCPMCRVPGHAIRVFHT